MADDDIFTKAMLGEDSSGSLPAGVEFVKQAPPMAGQAPATPAPTPTTPATPEVKTPPTPTPVATTPTPTPTPTPVKTEGLDKIEIARMAMEGPERTAKRKEEEHEEVVKGEIAVIDKRLAEIARDKEKLELAWVDLDDKRNTIKQTLDPIKEKEKAAEAEEVAIEEDEARQPFPKEKKVAEEKRWQIQEKRHQIEAEKWQVEQKMMVVEEKIAENTAAYQKFLDEEEELKTKRASLERDITPIAPPEATPNI